MTEIVHADDSAIQEYRTLFWVPMLFQSAKQSESIIDEMLCMIQDFHDTNKAHSHTRKSSVLKGKNRGAPKRRQQILGETIDADTTVHTRVDVVMKNDTTKFNILKVLKRHFLFSQLRDFELEDVIDVMQSCIASENEIIIQQGDPGDVFYVLEEGYCELFIDDKYHGVIEPGSSFGDLALMYNSPRAATIKTKTFCTLWTLDRIFFRQAMVTSSSNQNVQLSNFLQKITLFANISVSQLNQLARSLTKQSFEDGQYIIRQGELGDQFYVVYKGRVQVTKTDDSGQEHVLLELGEGEVFGERALIKKEPRKANVKAMGGSNSVANSVGNVEVYYLESADFYLMLGEFVDKFNKMNEFRIIRSAKPFTKLTDFRLKELISTFTTHRMFSGQRLVCGSHTLYLVIDGQFQASKSNERFASDGQSEVGNLEKTADEVAGALTAISDDGILASFTKEQLLEILKKQDEDDSRKTRRTSYIENRSRSMLEGNNNNTHNTGGGSDRSSSVLGYMGSVPTTTSSSTTTTAIDAGTIGYGGTASGSGGSGSGSGAMMNADDITERKFQLTAERCRLSALARKQALLDFSCTSLKELTVLSPLGKGTFGHVYLVHHPVTDKQLALKCLSIQTILEGGHYLYVRREILALQSFSHPFIGEYLGVIHAREKICFLLEFIPGGELWTYLYDESIAAPASGSSEEKKDNNNSNRRQVGEYGGLPIYHAALYAANIILALEHIHGLGYTYRDLKPENLLIHENGYVKLVDFGFAKQVPFVNPKNQQICYRTFTLCGTPDYMAPEVVLTQGHDRSADYWAYGALLYELVCGHTPFEGSTQQRTFEKIVHSQKHLQFPENNFDPHCKSLIRRLLHPNAALRIGALQNGIDDIKLHAFFTMKNINFDALLEQEVVMPYIPPSFDMQRSNSNSSNMAMDPLDIDWECQIDEEDEYHAYFEHLEDPDTE